MDPKYKLKTPFEKIALSLSGGGYRAASFHLGSMHYLNHVKLDEKPLLENVKIISTVSGGTITGVFYAHYIQEGRSFHEIFDDLMKLLEDFDLIKSAMAKLRDTDGWPTHKRRNLINAFAAIYDQEFMKGATFSSFNDLSENNLQEVVFNATEFNNGLLFRFQNEGDMGNAEIEIPKRVQPEIKLGDIIASSSCFPGGFEPLAFPDDFLYDGAEEMKALQRKEKFATPFALMDGGIVDNQGINSILLSEKRNLRKERKKLKIEREKLPEEEQSNDDDIHYYYDLVIISDVASPYMSPFEFTKPEEVEIPFMSNSAHKIWSTVKNYHKFVNTILWTILMASIAMIVFSQLKNNWLLGAGSVGILFSIVFMFLMNKSQKWALNLWSDIRKDLNKKFSFYLEKLEVLELEKLTLKQLRSPILDRVGSMMTLVQEVFLKQIRRMIYADVYQSEEWRYRRIGNLIYELGHRDFLNKRKLGKTKKLGPWISAEDQNNKDWTDQEVMDRILGKEIPKLADDASAFGTTLWFTPKDQVRNMLDKLVATGQVTMCYNLIQYINSIKSDDNSGYHETPSLKLLHEQLMEDWLKFVKDPYWMVPNHKKTEQV